MALLAIAPALTPDAALAMPAGRAFGLLAARRRLTKRSRPAGGAGGDPFMGLRGGDGESWTDAKGHRHTRISSMASLYGMMPRKD